jgi:Arc/MetJ-type ribon-helix-helix transcriptional regulator
MIQNLSQENEAFISAAVASGVYQDRSAAIEAGVSLLRRHELLTTRLRDSRRQLDDGEFVEFDAQSLGELFGRLEERAKNRSTLS